jgi:2-polyprenyl-6-methoxyphenol hydroxylase-like FAD-dependent oxidoreductase
MGQGANQALEDALTLANTLDSYPRIGSALRAYDRERRPRTQAIAVRSRRRGAVAQWQQRPAVAARHTLLRLMPARLLMRSLTPVVALEPTDIR